MRGSASAARRLLDPSLNVVASVRVVDQPDTIRVREHISLLLHLSSSDIVVVAHAPVVAVNDEHPLRPRPVVVPLVARVVFVRRARHAQDVDQLMKRIHVRVRREPTFHI